MEVTGGHNRSSTDINAGIRKLAQGRGGGWGLRREKYGAFAHRRYAQVFYNGVYHDDIPASVRGEVADYLRRAEELAG